MAGEEVAAAVALGGGGCVVGGFGGRWGAPAAEESAAALGGSVGRGGVCVCGVGAAGEERHCCGWWGVWVCCLWILKVVVDRIVPATRFRIERSNA